MSLFSRIPARMNISKSAARIPSSFTSVQRFSSTETLHPTKEKKVSTGRKLLQVVKDHGASAVIVYGTLWIIPFAGIYSLGAIYPFPDPILFAEQYLPTSWMDSFYNTFGKYFGLESGKPLSDRAVRVIWALAAEDLTEIPRVLGTMWLAPKVTRWRGKATTPSTETMK